jgi:hypothetical protein
VPANLLKAGKVLERDFTNLLAAVPRRLNAAPSIALLPVSRKISVVDVLSPPVMFCKFSAINVDIAQSTAHDSVGFFVSNINIPPTAPPIPAPTYVCQLLM